MAVATLDNYSVSPNAKWDWAMTYDEQKLELGPQIIILGLGYATSLIVAIGCVATIVH